jgi:hypothetical protein
MPQEFGRWVSGIHPMMQHLENAIAAYNVILLSVRRTNSESVVDYGANLALS